MLMVMDALAIFTCAFSLVFLSGLQGQHVSGKHKRMSFVTSMAISLMSLVTVKLVSQPTNWLTDIAYVFGGPCGIVSAIRFYPWFTARFPHFYDKRHLADRNRGLSL
jgi:hypothetical protein